MNLLHRTPAQWIAVGQQTSGSYYENTEGVEAAPVDTTVIFAPGGSVENTQSGDTVTTQPNLYDVDPSLPVAALDVFVVANRRYEVDGEPQRYQQDPFTGNQVGLVVALRKVTG